LSSKIEFFEDYIKTMSFDYHYLKHVLNDDPLHIITLYVNGCVGLIYMIDHLAAFSINFTNNYIFTYNEIQTKELLGVDLPPGCTYHLPDDEKIKEWIDLFKIDDPIFSVAFDKYINMPNFKFIKAARI
jgi:hypothetical protein